MMYQKVNDKSSCTSMKKKDHQHVFVQDKQRREWKEEKKGGNQDEPVISTNQNVTRDAARPTKNEPGRNNTH